MKRREALLSAVGLLGLSAGVSAAPRADMRFLRVRHATFVVELGDARVLLDPGFHRDLGLGLFASVPKPALVPDAIGKIDWLLVSASRSDHFSPRGLEPLVAHNPRCLVPDENVAKRLRHVGFRRVRVARAQDTFNGAGLEVAVSPALDVVTGAPAFGYRLERAGRSIWHTGPLPPLDIFYEPVDFARKNPSEVLLASAAAYVFGQRRAAMGTLDAQRLAKLSSARFLVAQESELRPNALGQLFLTREPARGLSTIENGRWVVVEHAA